MTYTLIEPPDDLYSDSALETWEEHLTWVERLAREDPNDEGVRYSLDEARYWVAVLRRERAENDPPHSS